MARNGVIASPTDDMSVQDPAEMKRTFKGLSTKDKKKARREMEKRKKTKKVAAVPTSTQEPVEIVTAQPSSIVEQCPQENTIKEELKRSIASAHEEPKQEVLDDEQEPQEKQELGEVNEAIGIADCDDSKIDLSSNEKETVEVKEAIDITDCDDNSKIDLSNEKQMVIMEVAEIIQDPVDVLEQSSVEHDSKSQEKSFHDSIIIEEAHEPTEEIITLQSPSIIKKGAEIEDGITRKAKAVVAAARAQEASGIIDPALQALFDATVTVDPISQICGHFPNTGRASKLLQKEAETVLEKDDVTEAGFITAVKDDQDMKYSTHHQVLRSRSSTDSGYQTDGLAKKIAQLDTSTKQDDGEQGALNIEGDGSVKKITQPDTSLEAHVDEQIAVTTVADSSVKKITHPDNSSETHAEEQIAVATPADKQQHTLSRKVSNNSLRSTDSHTKDDFASKVTQPSKQPEPKDPAIISCGPVVSKVAQSSYQHTLKDPAIINCDPAASKVAQSPDQPALQDPAIISCGSLLSPDAHHVSTLANNETPSTLDEEQHGDARDIAQRQAEHEPKANIMTRDPTAAETNLMGLITSISKPAHSATSNSTSRLRTPSEQGLLALVNGLSTIGAVDTESHHPISKVHLLGDAAIISVTSMLTITSNPFGLAFSSRRPRSAEEQKLLDVLTAIGDASCARPRSAEEQKLLDVVNEVEGKSDTAAHMGAGDEDARRRWAEHERFVNGEIDYVARARGEVPDYVVQGEEMMYGCCVPGYAQYVY
ncbi:hypothetical protein EJ04DRAFT_564252 [Polyplosphaeria fusca]|uniref:Uncharacterized protein n=1 Tax=Polyplosphaeria fusca TaxID=682080 RepID=A0A9P4V2P7_9PLEO|nr:hypothetical protein EJ04DRAFT_564252 [Polyplosphaeria fusca]